MDDIKVNQDEVNSSISKSSVETHELPNKDNFQCSLHPRYKIEAFVTHDKTDEVRLSCLKCIIQDSSSYKVEQGYQIHAIKDVFQSYVDGLDQIPEKSFILEGGELQRRFIDYMAKDYPSKYEAYFEEQSKTVDEEIRTISEELQKLKEKYKSCISAKKAQMDMKNNDIKIETGKLLTDGQDFDQPKFNSIGEIYGFLHTIDSKQQVSEFLKERGGNVSSLVRGCF